MAITISSNSRGGGSGLGGMRSSSKLTSCDRIVIQASAPGDVARIPMHSLWRPGNNMGPTFQAGLGVTNLNIKVTLEDEDFAMDPNNDALVPWHTWVASLAAQAAQAANVMVFTVAKITFTAAGSCYICSV